MHFYRVDQHVRAEEGGHGPDIPINICNKNSQKRPWKWPGDRAVRGWVAPGAAAQGCGSSGRCGGHSGPPLRPGTLPHCPPPHVARSLEYKIQSLVLPPLPLLTNTSNWTWAKLTKFNCVMHFIWDGINSRFLRPGLLNFFRSLPLCRSRKSPRFTQIRHHRGRGRRGVGTGVLEDFHDKARTHTTTTHPVHSCIRNEKTKICYLVFFSLKFFAPHWLRSPALGLAVLWNNSVM